MFSSLWSTFAAKPIWPYILQSYDFFFFSLKEEDYRIKNEEFLKTPEFAPHEMMGRTNLEA